MFPNRTTKWIVYKLTLVQEKFCLQLKPGLSPDFVHRVHGRSDANALYEKSLISCIYNNIDIM